jgi:GNAT superfamily N-acetyltransferase
MIEVEAVRRGSLPLLDSHLGNPGIPDLHQRRFEVQARGDGLYLAAWEDGAPIGNVLLHFRHPPHHACYERYPDHAYVEALDVRLESRRQGVGLALMVSAEQHARSSGAADIGLSVGVENTPARALYWKLGYRPADLADYPVSWTYLDPETGEPKEEGEICSYWARPLVDSLLAASQA